MQKWIPVLSGLLVLQLVLALVLNLAGEDYGAFRGEEKLIAFEVQAVDSVRIKDDKDGLVLKKRDDKWLLPESADFPASTASVDRLLNKLADLRKGWPVATTGSAARRFKVTEDQFERKLTLLSDEEPLAELYVGTSPGFRKVHVRPAGEEAVFAVAFNTWEASASVDDWIDKDILRLEEADVVRVETSEFVLQSEDDELKLADLRQKETTNDDEAGSLIRKIAGLRIQSLLGHEPKAEYRQNEPALELSVERKGGDVLNYRFSKPEEASYYVLKRSDVDRYFKIAGYAVEPILATTREKLVQTDNEAAGGETAGDEFADTGTKASE